MIDYPREWPIYSSSAIRRATRLLRLGRTFDYGHGREIADLEGAFAQVHGRKHALALNSGTSALLAGYYALGCGPGDEIVVPSYTFQATVTPLFLLGCVPVLSDAGSDSGNVSVHSIAPLITPKTRGIVVTHLWGHPCDMPAIRALADRHGLWLLEDCSHSHGSKIGGRLVGTFGDVSVFSIGARKMVSGGLGGILLTDSRRLYDTACLVSNFGARSRMTVTHPALRPFATLGFGGNLRISPIAAVLAMDHFCNLDRLIEWKRRNSEAVGAVLAETFPCLTPQPREPACTMGAWYGLLMLCRKSRLVARDQFLELLLAAGIRVSVPRTVPLHLSAVFRGNVPSGWMHYSSRDKSQHFAYVRGDCPRATYLFDNWIALPSTFLYDKRGQLVRPFLQAARALRDKIARSRRLRHLMEYVDVRRDSS